MGEQMDLLRTPVDRISHRSVLTGLSWDLILYSGHTEVRAASALIAVHSLAARQLQL